MTQKLEELFNLPPIENTEERGSSEEKSVSASTFNEMETILSEANNILDKVDRALPTVYDLDHTDTELDDLSALAKDKFEVLMTLGMNVEPRFSKDILNAATACLASAITAKNAKVESKLRRIDLQIKKMRADAAANAKNKDNNENEPLEAYEVVDRNTLLASIVNEIKKNGKNS